MLIEFRCANHRSIRDEQVLTMEASANGDKDDPRPRTVKGSKAKLLPVAVLYGANASGKSNVLSAFEFMRIAVLNSQLSWPPRGLVPRQPFAWGSKKTEPSVFEVKVNIHGVVYQYGFSVSNAAILEEWLYAWPKNKRQTWFERTDDQFVFGDNLKGGNQVIRGVTRQNSLFLSAAAQMGHKQLDALYGWFFWSNVADQHSKSFDSWILNSHFERPRKELMKISGLKLAVAETVDRFQRLIRQADIGIVDFRQDDRASANEVDASQQANWLVRHQAGTEEAWLTLEEESRGTKTFFRLALPILQAFDMGSLLLVDELESSLHPALAYKIVQLFNDPESNPKNAQLLTTTHDTNLLGSTIGEPAFRRDQVWLTEKDDQGATVLYPLTDFKPRKEENLERGYLQGRYGAIPFLGNFMTTAK